MVVEVRRALRTGRLGLALLPCVMRRLGVQLYHGAFRRQCFGAAGSSSPGANYADDADNPNPGVPAYCPLADGSQSTCPDGYVCLPNGCGYI